MPGRRTSIELFIEKKTVEIPNVGPAKEDIDVDGIPQDSPPFENTCQTNSFLTALRLAFFYEENFVDNFKHRRQQPKAAEDALRVIGLHCREIRVNPSLVKMAWNTISKVR